jgi:hypothetical protein
MTNAPILSEIWNDNEWQNFAPRAQHSRRYYKARSIFRMTFWVPAILLFVELAASILGTYK